MSRSSSSWASSPAWILAMCPSTEVEHDRDYFGRTVNLASRVTGVAGGR